MEKQISPQTAAKLLALGLCRAEAKHDTRIPGWIAWCLVLLGLRVMKNPHPTHRRAPRDWHTPAWIAGVWLALAVFAFWAAAVWAL